MRIALSGSDVRSRAGACLSRAHDDTTDDDDDVGWY